MKLLNKQKINYVLFHLNLIACIDELKSYFKFISYDEIENNNFSGEIIFPLSEKDFDYNNILTISNIPVLFPLSNEKKFFKIDSNNNLVFTHDLISSSFYLISGLQEYNSTKKDNFGRFPYEVSLQKKLGVINKPIVNYYFEIIINAINEWGIHKNIKIDKNIIFKNFGILLTHDVDKIDTFDYFEVGYKFKQLLGIAPSQNKLVKRLKILLYYFFNWLNIFNRKNFHWDFGQIRRTEKKYNFNSVFFFLQKDILHADSYYHYSDKRIKSLFHSLHNDNCEIALHGTVNSAKSLDSMKKILENLKSESPQDIFGIRQHRLIFENTLTSQLQEKAGLRYDTTIGFAEHEGFRNSFCFPYRIFDHENDKMLNIWEFPLIAMDTTLFKYRNLNIEDALNKINNLISEIIKFNGLFTFLWHNGFQVDADINGINLFYEMLLKSLKEKNGEGILGNKLLNRLPK